VVPYFVSEIKLISMALAGFTFSSTIALTHAQARLEQNAQG
jgi:hypothetical protein